ncbi:unnamed protein product, partial [Rotaria sordida]
VGLLIRVRPPNHCTRRIVGSSYIKVYASEPCIADRFQESERGSGSYLLCPPGTMNDGSERSRKECMTCIKKNSTNYCLRAPLIEISMIDVQKFRSSNFLS